MTEIYKIYYHKFYENGVPRYAGCYILGTANLMHGNPLTPSLISIVKGKVIVGFTNGETHEFAYDPNNVEIFRRDKNAKEIQTTDNEG